MSDFVDSIVNPRISADTTTTEREAFGTPMFVGYHTKWTDLSREYASGSEMIDDGFTVNDPLYRMVASAKAQDPTVRKVKVGRLTTAVADTKKITISTSTAGKVISFTLTGPDGVEHAISRTVPGASSLGAEATAVAALVDALTGIAAVASSSHFTATGDTAGQTWYYSDLVNCTLLDQTPDASVDTDLSAILVVDSNWYGLACVYESEVNADKIATWTETNKKWYVPHSADDIELDGTGVMGQGWKDASLARTSGVWSRDTIHYPAAALIGRISAGDPGSISATFKRLRGVAVDVLTSTQQTNLSTDNWNYYITARTKPVLFAGKVASGEWIDIVIGSDWLANELQVEVFDFISTPDKVDFDQAGIAGIAGIIRGVLAEAVRRRILDPGNGDDVAAPSVHAPRVTDILPSDRAERRVTQFRFSGRLRGAIVYVDPIDGLLTV